MIVELAKEYPGKKIICLPKKNPKEVICEIASAPDGSWSLAVVLIIRSVPHYHEKTKEVYHTLKGAVRVMNAAGTKRGTVLTQWQEGAVKGIEWESSAPMVLWPSLVHCAWAIGRYPAKVLVMATPAWSKLDHHLRSDIRKPFILD